MKNKSGIEELLDFHKAFAENVIKTNRSFAPQVVISANGQAIPIVIQGDRYTIKKILDLIERVKSRIDWIVVMHEGYMAKNVKSNEIDEYAGNLEQRYLVGDNGIKWVFMIQAYWKKGKTTIKKMRVYEIQRVSLDFKFEYEANEFEGYLTIQI